MIVISLIVTVAITLTVTTTATVRVTVTVTGIVTVTVVTIAIILTIPDGKEVYTMHCDCVLSTEQNGADSTKTLHPQRGRHSLDSSCNRYKLVRP